jgi:L,D-transpeptidase YcbB
MSHQGRKINQLLKKWMQKAAIVVIFLGIILFSSYQHPLNKEEYKDYFLPGAQLNLNYLYAPVESDSTQEGNLKYLVASFYNEANYKPVWTFETELNEKARDLVRLLNGAEYYGFRKESYGINGLLTRIEKLKSVTDPDHIIKQRVGLESALTEIGFRFLINLHKGMLDFDTLRLSQQTSHFYIEKFHLALLDDVEKHFLSVQPQFIEYKRLQKANETFIRNIGLSHQSAQIEYPVKNDTAAKHAAANILYHWGIMDSSDIGNNTVFPGALKKFQRMHSIESNGILTRETINRLNKTTDELFKVIANNLDDYRKRNDKQGNCVYINIPSYSLKLIQNNHVIRQYNIVVGKRATPTPVLESDISTIITNPYWTVPKRIALEELIPKIRQDSTYLARNGFKLIDQEFNEIDMGEIDFNNIDHREFNYKFRQEASEGNALGKIKFMFNNPYSVYLHDTPSKKQFDLHSRAFSHGCIRVQDPIDFARELLQLKEQPDENQYKLTSDKREFIKLRDPVKIYITYNLCGVDENNNLVFYKDIYDQGNGILN